MPILEKPVFNKASFQQSVFSIANFKNPIITTYHQSQFTVRKHFRLIDCVFNFNEQYFSYFYDENKFMHTASIRLTDVSGMLCISKLIAKGKEDITNRTGRNCLTMVTNNHWYMLQTVPQ